MINKNNSILPNKITNNQNINYIAGFRRRVYDSDNLLEHVLAECLDDKVLKGIPLSKVTENCIQEFFKEEISEHIAKIANEEHLNLEELLLERLEFEAIHSQREAPEKVIHIIGSPRSGTTHLFNLLAYHPVFSYFTAISHFIWSSYNFNKNASKKFIEDSDPSILELDNMFLRYSFTPLILPSESQEIFNKAIPVRKRKGGFNCNIFTPHNESVDISLLRSAIEKHVSLFKRKFFLSKDPFNSLRIPSLESMYPGKTYFIHIFRNGYDVTNSFNNYGFNYFNPDKNITLTGKNIWLHFIKKIMDDSLNTRTYHVSYEALMSNTDRILREIFDWVGVPIPQLKHIPKKIQKNNLAQSGDKDIDDMNRQLANLPCAFQESA